MSVSQSARRTTLPGSAPPSEAARERAGSARVRTARRVRGRANERSSEEGGGIREREGTNRQPSERRE